VIHDRKHKPVIGLVGAIGSGKSTVAQMLAERGGFVIAADPLAHEALKDPRIRSQVAERFGPEVVGTDGEIVRSRLAGPVFADPVRRRELESWIFPWVGERVRELCHKADADAEARFVVLDAPVMLEAGWNDAWDRLIYVYVPRDVQLARLASRGWTAQQLQAREQAQLSAAEKAARADATVDNSGPQEATARQLDGLLRQWKLI
jgi:dephospho-CoA kinase